MDTIDTFLSQAKTRIPEKSRLITNAHWKQKFTLDILVGITAKLTEQKV